MPYLDRGLDKGTECVSALYPTHRSFKSTIYFQPHVPTWTGSTQTDLSQHDWKIVCKFVLLLKVSVNNFSVMLGRFSVFLALTSTKLRIKCLAQGHNAVSPVSFELATLRP